MKPILKARGKFGIIDVARVQAQKLVTSFGGEVIKEKYFAPALEIITKARTALARRNADARDPSFFCADARSRRPALQRIKRAWTSSMTLRGYCAPTRGQEHQRRPSVQPPNQRPRRRRRRWR